MGKMKSRVGDFEVWHVGRMNYEVRDRRTGEVVGSAPNLMLAHGRASRLYDLEKMEARDA